MPAKARQVYYRTASCFQRCFGIPIQTVYTIEARLFFSNIALAVLKNNILILQAALKTRLGYNVTITGVGAVSNRRRSSDQVAVDYSIDAVGDGKRDQVMASVEDLNTPTGTSDFVATLASTYANGGSGGGSNPFTSASVTGSSPQASESVKGGGDGDSGSSSNAGAIAGGIIGALLCVGLLAGVAFVYIRRQQSIDRMNKVWSMESGNGATTQNFDNPAYGGGPAGGQGAASHYAQVPAAAGRPAFGSDSAA